MPDEASSPFLGSAGPSNAATPPSKHSNASIRSKRSRESKISDESTPLLSRQEDDRPSYNDDNAANGVATSPAARSLQSLQDGQGGKGKGQKRIATVVALSILSVIVLAILGLGFAAPAVVEEYAKEAVVVEPTNLSIDSFTATGVRARIQAKVVLDASRVHKKSVRDLGRAATWTAGEIECKESHVKVYLPEYGNVLLGTATVPPIKVNIRNGHINHVDFLSDLEPGDIDGIRGVANDWLEGRLGRLRIKGVADLDLKSGVFSLGTQSISESLVFEGHDLPSFHEFNITKLNFHEVDLSQREKGMAADASISLQNDYPVLFDIPPLGFDILVSNCFEWEDNILLAKATTNTTEVRPKQAIQVDVTGVVRELSAELVLACPGSDSSPLDVLVGDYLQGQETTIFVRGSDSPSEGTPGWITDLMKSVTVPLPIPGHPFDNLIKNFSLTNVHFSLPNPLADPDSPEAQPRLSADIKVLVGLPEEMNFPLDISHVRADADVFYHGKKLGRLDLQKWQEANATRIRDSNDNGAPALLISAAVDDAPLEVTDDDVFTEVVQALVFGSKGVTLTVKADVDVFTVTALGEHIIRQIPAQGKVFIRPISGGGLTKFCPKIGSLKILDTTESSVLLEAKVNITNPTDYSASVPFVDIHILNNNTILGHVTAKNLSIAPGNNTNLVVEMLWNPAGATGKSGLSVGRELLSQYLSGYNTTLTLKTYESSIPSQPALGKALSVFELEIPTPRLGAPKDPDGDGDGDDEGEDEEPHFIKDATMHLISSTATFTLLSPLSKTTLYITFINATAYYNHTDPVGVIVYDLPFAVPPGASESPRLPVDWSLGGAGYDAVRDALGGSLKLDAKADVGVRIGLYEVRVWFVGGGIGAHVRL